MNFNDLFTLFIEGTFVAGIVLILFRLRKNLGLGILYACLAIYQFIQIIIFFLNTIYETTLSNFFVSPGSSFFITVTLFSLLIIYIKEGAKETKKLIYAILIVNILITILTLDFTSNLENYNSENALSNPNDFIFTARILFFGNSVLFIDSFLLIIIFEFFAKKIKSLFFQVFFTMLIIVSLDTILFSITTFWNLDNLIPILIRSLIAKNSFAIYYSILFYLYLKYFDSEDKDLLYIKTKDIFKPLSYKQKFEAALTNVKKSEEMYRLIADNSYDIISLLDLNGIYKYVSPSIKTILGYNQSEFIGKTIFSIVHNEDLKQLKENLDNRSFKNKNNTYTFRLLHTNGYYLWIEYTIAPIYENNKITSFVSSARDVTKRVTTDIEFKKYSKLLKIREHFLNESSKIAKIGFAEYNDEIKSFTWSDYLYTIFGVKQTNKLPTHEEFINFFDDRSKLKIKKGIEKLYANGTPIKEELKVINTPNDVVWISVIINPIYNNNKIVIGRRAVVQNITDYKNTQFELEKSKQEIESSYNLLKEKDNSLKQTSKIAKIGYWEYSLKYESFTLSSYVYTIYALDPKNKIPTRKELIEFYDKSSREKYETAIKNLEINGDPFDLELKIINAKKEEVWVRVVVQLVKDSNNNSIGRQGIIQDITETKKARLALEKSNLEIKNSIELIEQKEHSLKETRKIAQLGYSEFIYETESYIWTDYMYNIFGLEPKDKIPKKDKLLALYDNESYKKIQEATLALETNGTPYDIELKLINFKQEEVWIRLVTHLIYNSQNKPIGRGGVFRDITSYKKNQLKLERYLKQLELKDIALKESSKIAKIGFVEYYFENKVFIWSDYVYTIFGLNIDDKIPDFEELENLFDNESKIKINRAFKNLSYKDNYIDFELKGINKKNKTFWIRQITQPIFNEQKQIIGRKSILQDITSYKTYQLELEKSKKEIQNSLKLLENSEYNKNQASKFAKIGFHEFYHETEQFYWSEYIYTIFGLDPNKKIPTRTVMVNLFFEKSKNKLNKATTDLETYGLPYDLELKLTNFKNEIIWIRMSNHPIYNDNKIIGRRGILQNITERKKIEKENLKIKNNYIRLFDNATISIWNEDLSLLYLEINKLKKQNISDIKNYLENNFNILIKLKDKIKVNYVNNATVKLFKAENQLDFLKNIHSSFGDGAEKVFLNMIIAIWNNEDTFTSEANFKTLDGNQFTAIISAPIPKTIEEQKTVPVSIQSIQSIKDTEIALKESFNNLKEAQKLGRLGNFEINPITNVFTWSDEIFNIYEFDKNNGYPSYNDVVNTVHPEDLEKHNFYIEKALKHGKPFDIELRIITPKNNEKTIRIICELVKNNEGQVIFVKGINQDITEHKKIISKIKKTQEMYSLVTNNTNDLICLHDLKGKIIFMSHSIKRVLGYDILKEYEQAFYNIIHYDDQEKIKEHIKLTSKEKNYKKLIAFRARHFDGHFIWFEAHTSLAYKENDKTYLVTIARDISESVKVKHEIEEYQKSLQELTTEITLVEEQQKKEIASNIHDHLSQALVISNMKINELKQRGNLKDIEQELIFIEELLTNAIAKSRKITLELSPPILHQLGLKHAVHWLLDNIENNHNITCILNDDTESFQLNEIKSILIYRSIQEILNNTIKYAQASQIKVEFNVNNSILNITIMDNGIGFNISKLNNLRSKNGSGFGLFTVRERISNIKGEFKIFSEIEKGTTINILIPLIDE